jgi:hypothetical protein
VFGSASTPFQHPFNTMFVQYIQAKVMERLVGVIATILVNIRFSTRYERTRSKTKSQTKRLSMGESNTEEAITEEAISSPMTRPAGVEPTLLGLPFEVRTIILDYALSIDRRRVEHSSYWRELSEGEFDWMVGRIDPWDTYIYSYSDRERSQKGYKKNVVCELDFSLMLSSKQCYEEGLEIMRYQNRFVQIDGWMDENYEALAELGNIPIWAYQPVWNEETLLAQPLPCKVEPVLRLAYESRRHGGSIFISIKDFPLVSKSLYHLHSSPVGRQAALACLFTLPDEGLTPDFWGFKTEAEVRTFLQASLIRYFGVWLRNIYWGEMGTIVHTPEFALFHLGRTLNGLEEWVVENIPAWDLVPEKSKYDYMYGNAVELFSEAEQANADGGISTAIGLYFEVKALVDQLCREEPSWRTNQSQQVIQDLYNKYSTCCFRLSSMADSPKKPVPANQPGPSLAVKQWAYINVVEALTMVRFIGRRPRFRASLLINQAALMLELQRYPDVSITSALCLATFEIMKHRSPLVRGRTLLDMAHKHFLNGDPPSARRWTEDIELHHGYYFSNRRARNHSFKSARFKLTPSEWERKFKRVHALFEETFNPDT